MTPAEAVERRTIAANWMLGPQMAGPATRLVLGISNAQDPEAVRTLLAAARAELSAADAALQAWKGDETADARRPSQANVQLLRSFASAMAAAWPTADADSAVAQAALSEAGLELVDALEDKRPDVVAAAVLWQGVLHSAAGRGQRALDALPPALSAPDTKSTFGFFPRLLRCRLLGAAPGNRATALALTARVEASCENWLDSEATAKGRAAATLVRRQILEAWASEQRSAGASARAAWCDEQIKKLDESLAFTGEPVRVLALPGGAPEVVNLADLAERMERRVPATPAPVTTDGEAPAPPEDVHAPAATPAPDDANTPSAPVQPS
jgi:hypothetical protein